MGFEIVRLDHVQLAMPPGREAEAEAFYSVCSGSNGSQARALAARGGCWFVRGPVACTSGSRRASVPPARRIRPWWCATWPPWRRR